MQTTTLVPLWPEFQYLEHQVVGVEWMLTRESAANGPKGGILCDEMGLGKTIQIAGLLKNSPVSPFQQHNLLVAPVAVLEQWKAVARRAGFAVFVPSASGVSWQPEGAVGAGAPMALHIIGYEKALAKPLLVRAYTWTRCIYDEAHRLSSNNSSTDLAKKIRAHHMWLLTATPIINQLRDFRILLELVGLEKVPHASDPKEFGGLLQTYVLARSMDQLRSSIPNAPPPPQFFSTALEFLTEDEAEFYRGISGIITRRWKALEHDGGRGAAFEKLQLFMRLRQISLHPQVYIAGRKKTLGTLYTRPDWTATSTKFTAIQRLIEAEKEGARKWIVFCHFHEEMELLAQDLRATGSVESVNLYHGGLSAVQKQAVLEKTHGPVGRHQVLLLQLQSGGTGLNLQHFDRIIFSGPWWTQALMSQAVGRAVRIGQRSIVKVFHLHLKEEEALNIDEIINERADSKGKMCLSVLEGANRTICRGGETGVVGVAAAVVIAPLDLGLVKVPDYIDSDLEDSDLDSDLEDPAECEEVN